MKKLKKLLPTRKLFVTLLEISNLTIIDMKHFIPTLGALVCIANLSYAGSVNFSSAVIDPSDTTGSFLDNSGTILDAVNFGTSRSAPYTYNAPTTPSNPDPNVTLNGITFTSTAGATTLGDTYYSLVAPSGSVGYDTGRFSNVSDENQPLYGLVYDVARSSGNNVRLELTLNSLTLGQDYELQLIFSTMNSQDNPNGDTRDRNVEVTAGAFTESGDAQHGSGTDGDSGTLIYGPTTGAIIINANFTADSATEEFDLLSGTTGGNSRVSLAGLVISAVPEPSTYALLMIGGIALGIFMWRKNKKLA